MVNQVGAQELDEFASRLGWLLDHVPGPTGERWTYEGLARECTRRGTPLTSTAIRHYLRGRRSAPPARTVFELADIFDIDPRYFWRAEYAQRIRGEIARLAERRL